MERWRGTCRSNGRAITVRPARILFLRNHNSESRYRIELHGDRWPDEFGRAGRSIGQRGVGHVFARLCTHASARASNDNAFSRRCSRHDRRTDRFSFTMRVCLFRVRACEHIYTGTFFLRVALLLHGTSGHVPPVTTPSTPVHPVTKPPTLDAPERTPARPTLVTSATSFFARFYVLSVLLFHPLAADAASARVRHFNKNLLTFPTPRMRTRRVSLASARNYRWTIPRDQ